MMTPLQTWCIICKYSWSHCKQGVNSTAKLLQLTLLKPTKDDKLFALGNLVSLLKLTYFEQCLSTQHAEVCSQGMQLFGANISAADSDRFWTGKKNLKIIHSGISSKVIGDSFFKG